MSLPQFDDGLDVESSRINYEFVLKKPEDLGEVLTGLSTLTQLYECCSFEETVLLPPPTHVQNANNEGDNSSNAHNIISSEDKKKEEEETRIQYPQRDREEHPIESEVSTVKLVFAVHLKVKSRVSVFRFLFAWIERIRRPLKVYRNIQKEYLKKPAVQFYLRNKNQEKDIAHSYLQDEIILRNSDVIRMLCNAKESNDSYVFKELANNFSEYLFLGKVSQIISKFTRKKRNINSRDARNAGK